MTEYSRIARGSYTATTGKSQVINLPFQPTRIELTNYTAYANFAENGIPQAFWDIAMGQGTAAVLLNSGATPTLITDVVTANGFSTFSAGIALQFGPKQQIIGATKANPIVFNVTAHGYNVGDVVIFEGLYQTATTGMPQISGMPFVISAVGDANHFSVVWQATGSNYTALSGSPTGAYVQKVLYPYLYEPAVAFIEAVTTGATTTVTTTAPNNFVVGQEIAFRIPTAWGITQLNSLPDALIPGSPIYGYVTSVTNSTTFVCSINSTGYTAFNPNVPVTSVPGLTAPQVLAVGDINSGGTIYSGGAIYPSPLVNGISTINGPAISGAFINNTSQGFIIGAGASVTDSSSNLSGTTGDLVTWQAFYCDIG
jgi:hypothetical protein